MAVNDCTNDFDPGICYDKVAFFLTRHGWIFQIADYTSQTYWDRQICQLAYERWLETGHE